MFLFFAALCRSHPTPLYFNSGPPLKYQMFVKKMLKCLSPTYSFLHCHDHSPYCSCHLWPTLSFFSLSYSLASRLPFSCFMLLCWRLLFQHTSPSLTLGVLSWMLLLLLVVGPSCCSSVFLHLLGSGFWDVSSSVVPVTAVSSYWCSPCSPSFPLSISFKVSASMVVYVSVCLSFCCLSTLEHE